MATENAIVPEKVQKYDFTYRIGRRLLALFMVVILIGGMVLAWQVRIQDLRKQYVGSALEYASQVTQNNTGYLNQSVIERAWRVLTTAVRKPKTFEEFETYASLAIAKGLYEDGIGYLQSCIDTYPGESDSELARLWLRKGSLYTLSEQFEPATECYNKALSLDPNIPDAYLLRAQMESEQGDMESAAADLRTYEAMAGSHPVIQAALGGLYESAEDYENAVKCYTEAIKSEQYDVSNLASRGRCRILLGDSAGALQDLERFFQEGGADTTGDIYAMLGMCRMEAKNYADARKAFYSAIQMGYSDPKLIWTQCVACDYIMQDHDAVVEDGAKALEAIEKYGGTNEEIGELNQWIGFSYFVKNEYEQAAQAFETALGNNPALSFVPYYAGICCMSSGEHEKAAAYFLQSAQRNEYPSICLYNAALCFIQLEDYQSAEIQLAEAIEAGDDEEAVSEAKSLLAEVRAYLKMHPPDPSQKNQSDAETETLKQK